MGRYKDGSNGEYFEPLYALVNRIRYYPLWQTVYILGSIWFYVISGFGGTTSYDVTSTAGLYAVIALMLYAVCCSVTGIGYFMVFLGKIDCGFLFMTDLLINSLLFPCFWIGIIWCSNAGEITFNAISMCLPSNNLYFLHIFPFTCSCCIERSLKVRMNSHRYLEIP